MQGAEEPKKEGGWGPAVKKAGAYTACQKKYCGVTEMKIDWTRGRKRERKLGNLKIRGKEWETCVEAPMEHAFYIFGKLKATFRKKQREKVPEVNVLKVVTVESEGRPRALVGDQVLRLSHGTSQWGTMQNFIWACVGNQGGGVV